MKLRPYQQDAADAIFAKWREFRKLLLVLPTGCGKTIVFSHVAARIAADGGRTLILAHRDELIRQAVEKLHAATGIMAAVEKGDEHGAGSMYPVTVGSVQTMMRAKRLADWPRDWFRTVIVDEAHHALSSSYQNVLNHFAGAQVLGVTATPDRGDKRNLGSYFEDIPYQYDLRQAVKDGFLSRIVAHTIPLRINLDNVRVTAGDFNDSDLGDALAPYMSQIADCIIKEAGARKTLVFLPLVRTSRAFCDLLRSKGMDARHADGTSEDRADVRQWLASPGPKACCNAMLYTEGFDEPSLDCVVVLRATKSRPLYAQMVGRGTRLFPGKRDLLLLDFLWHTERHELCHPASLVAEKQEVAEQMQTIQEEQSAGGQQMDLLDMESLARDELVRKRHEALAKALKEQERKARSAIDPVFLGVMLGDSDLEDYEPTMKWEAAPPTQPQLAALARFGISADAVAYKGQASKLMGKLIARRQAGLAMPKQLAQLRKYGYDGLADLSMKDASALMDRIAQVGWRTDDVWSFA